MRYLKKKLVNFQDTINENYIHLNFSLKYQIQMKTFWKLFKICLKQL